MKTQPSLLQRLAGPRARAGTNLGLWVGAVLLLEVVGPKLGPDTGLVLGWIGVGLLLRATLRLHREAPLPWLRPFARLASKLREFWRRQGPLMGLDLRGTPPVPRGWPPVLLLPLLGSGLLLLLLLPFAAGFPAALVGLARLSFTLYTAVAGLLLAANLAAGALCAMAALLTLRERLRYRPPHAAILVGGLVLAAILPVVGFFEGPSWLPLLGPAACLAASLLAMGTGRRGEVETLWRTAQSARVRSVSAMAMTGAQFALGAIGALLLALVSAGHRLLGGPSVAEGEDLVLLPLVGFLFAWCAAYGFLALTVVLVRWQRARALAQRAARAPTSLHLSGVLGGAERKEVRRRLSRLGLAVRFGPGAPRPGEVAARFSDSWHPEAEDPFEADRLDRPLVLAPSDLEGAAGAALCQRAERRDARLCRARILAAIPRLLRAARRQHAGQRGEGYWLGPEHWFLAAVGRDRQTDEDELRASMLEPPPACAYARALDWRARAHLGAVLRDLEVDLIFVQDGVPLGGIRRVYQTLFEAHDVFGGHRRAEERDFAGLVGLRVVLHDFELDRPFARPGYPEPDYEDLARARILHVFRDRGGDWADESTPNHLIDLPSPLLSR